MGPDGQARAYRCVSLIAFALAPFFLIVCFADVASYDQFGRGLTVSRHLIVAGASYDDDKGSSSGSMYAFEIADYFSV